MLLSRFVPLSVLMISISMTNWCVADADISDYELGLIAYSQQDYAAASNLFVQAAKNGEVGADHMLMRMYADGVGVQRSSNWVNILLTAQVQLWILSKPHFGISAPVPMAHILPYIN